MSTTTIRVSGKSTGGANYISRILRAHLERGFDVEVVVGFGKHQYQVYNNVLRDIKLLNQAVSYNFYVTVTFG